MSSQQQLTNQQKLEKKVLNIRQRVNGKQTKPEVRRFEPGRNLAFALITSSVGSIPWAQFESLDEYEQNRTLNELDAIEGLLAEKISADMETKERHEILEDLAQQGLIG